MPGVEPLDRSDLEDLEPLLQAVEQVMGFVPNSMLTMARKPDLLRAFSALAGSVLGPGKLSRELKQLVAFVTSNAAGCRYCQAHTSHSAHRAGSSAEKIEAAFEYETNSLFDEAERAALRLAQSAGLVPNQSTPEHFEALREHFDDEGIVELVSVISLFGYLNRWNDTMATRLESEPTRFAEERLSARGWVLGKHGGLEQSS